MPRKGILPILEIPIDREIFRFSIAAFWQYQGGG